MESKKFAYFISELILQKKGTNIKVLDLREVTGITDFFVISSASSDVQIKAISDHIIKEAKKKGEKVWHNEGTMSLNWVLLDFVDVVVHIFNEETRRFYNLEGLWGDAQVTIVNEDFNFKKVK